MTMMLDTHQLMDALARLKSIPLAKVVRNAARDYVQAAEKVTPLAKQGKSRYVKAAYYAVGDVSYTTKKGKVKTRRDFLRNGNGHKIRTGNYWYIPADRVGSLKASKKTGLVIRKVRVSKGWSKMTWVGAMRELGMTTKSRPASLPASVEAKSHTAQQGGDNPSITITDEFRFDRFGRSTTDAAFGRISSSGFALAAKRMSNEYERMIKETWK